MKFKSFKNKLIKEYAITALILFGILYVGIIIGLGYTDADIAGGLLGLVTGVILILKFKQFSKFLDDSADGIPSIFPKKWMVIFAQALVLFIGLWLFIGFLKAIWLTIYS